MEEERERALLVAIEQAVVEGEDAEATRRVEEALASGLPPLVIMQEGLVAGIHTTGELWHANEYFLPDVILAAEAFKTAMIPLSPRLKEGREAGSEHRFVLGVVEGDVHDLGKNLVAAMLESAGFDVLDLGTNVARASFVEAVRTHHPAIVGLGAYMTTTMLAMQGIIAELEAEGLRPGVKVMVGGVPTSQEFADEVGADAWGKDALDAMQKALDLVGA